MALTPDTLTRHELIGLPVRVADAANADLVGSSGRIVDETMRTFRVDDGCRVRQVPKRGSCFEFALKTDDAQRAVASSGTDEAADAKEASGSVSELGSETAGVRPGKSGPSAASRSLGRGASLRGGEPSPEGTANHLDTRGERSKPRDGECQDTVYVTVDGCRLLSRPAARTERGGDSIWQ